MSSNFFAMVNRMKLIDRWALMNNTTKENIAEHSHCVAVIAHALALIGNKKFGKNYNAERGAALLQCVEKRERQMSSWARS